MERLPLIESDPVSILDVGAGPASSLGNARRADGSRQDGFVILRHWRNEGHRAGYEELHQWNIDVVNGDLVIWNQRHRQQLAEIAAGSPFQREIGSPGRMVTAVVRKGGS